MKRRPLKRILRIKSGRPSNISPACARILNSITETPVSIDTLAAKLGKSPVTVYTHVKLLETLAYVRKVRN